MVMVEPRLEPPSEGLGFSSAVSGDYKGNRLWVGMQSYSGPEDKPGTEPGVRVCNLDLCKVPLWAPVHLFFWT